MTIGIDISQTVYEGTGVARYVLHLVSEIVNSDKENTFVLFGSSFRRRGRLWEIARTLKGERTNVVIKIFPFPPSLLDIIWNRLHILPIEWLIGHLDVFWSSDWTQPPLAWARGLTTIHDLSIFRFPQSFDATIVDVQKRRLFQAAKECDHFLCDSVATKNDATKFLGITTDSLSVVYPGLSPFI